MVWKPAKRLGLAVGLVIALTVVGVDVFLVNRVLKQGFDLISYSAGLLLISSFPWLALWGYWYYGLLTLGYYLDRNALVITCGFSSHVVPLQSIRSVVPGSQVAVSRRFRGVGWPGYLRGRMRLKGLGVLLMYSSEPLERQLVIVTGSGCYGISPRDAQGFSEALEARRALGPMRPVEHTVQHGRVAALAIWRDAWFWVIIAVAVVANAALFGFIARLYRFLPARMPLRLDARGEVGRIVSKTSLLLVPSIGAVTLGVNSILGFLFHRYEPLAAHLLAAVSLTVQPILWCATVGIVGL